MTARSRFDARRSPVHGIFSARVRVAARTRRNRARPRTRAPCRRAAACAGCVVRRRRGGGRRFGAPSISACSASRSSTSHCSSRRAMRSSASRRSPSVAATRACASVSNVCTSSSIIRAVLAAAAVARMPYARHAGTRVAVIESHEPIFSLIPYCMTMARHRGRALEIVLRARRHVAEHEFLGSAAAEQRIDPVEQLASAQYVAILGRHLLRIAERRDTARNDRHLLHRIAMGAAFRDERVAGLVIRDGQFLLRIHHAALALEARQRAVDRFVEVGHADCLLPSSAACSAASLTTFARSAPTKPACATRVRRDRRRPRVSRASRARRGSASAIHVRAGRSRCDDRSGPAAAARIRISGRFVAAMMITPEPAWKPSISTSN